LAEHDVTILENSDYIGGRILTSDHGYEIGAGRLATSHPRVMALVKRFKLQTFPLSKPSLWKGLDDVHPSENHFADVWKNFITIFAGFSKATLATHTLRELAEKTAGRALTDRILEQFGYRAETDTLRADLGIEAFRRDMSPTTSFVVVKGGLSSIVRALAANKTVRLNTTVTDVVRSGASYEVQIKGGPPVKADRVILALPVNALRLLPCMAPFIPLQHLKMEPLTRIYAQFVTPWLFEQRIVTDSPLRYIIPINKDAGIVMISYVESQDTTRFHNLHGKALVDTLRQELHRLFPGRRIPEIKWARPYEWDNGCSYWLPGTYDPVAESTQALQPFPKTMPGLHLCNESFSLRQAWIEGSLEHAAALLAHLKRHSREA
jgi:monoamine oxidase